MHWSSQKYLTLNLKTPLSIEQDIKRLVKPRPSRQYFFSISLVINCLQGLWAYYEFGFSIILHIIMKYIFDLKDFNVMIELLFIFCCISEFTTLILISMINIFYIHL